MDMLSQIKGDLADKFWKQVEKGENPEDCWMWTGRVQQGNSRGVFRLSYGSGKLPPGVKDANIATTKVSWFLAYNEALEGEVLLSCSNPRCVNPEHIIPATLENRFWLRVVKTNDCWRWTGCKDKDGYGKIGARIDGKNFYGRAHRVSWELHNNQKIPKGLVICHRCDNPECTNPTHLFLGTPAENSKDAAKKGRMPRGENSPRARFTEIQILKARTLRDLGVPGKQISQWIGIRGGNLHRILSDEGWKHVS